MSEECVNSKEYMEQMLQHQQKHIRELVNLVDDIENCVVTEQITDPSEVCNTVFHMIEQHKESYYE